MRKGVHVSVLMRNMKRAVAVAVAALLLGLVTAPETSLAFQFHPVAHHAPMSHPQDGTGDSPLVP
jgi:hypothetical protein